ncbi:hypothetical protein B7R54_11200 [Subtercola boreus]|uniref:DUF559 domain-containing protein n=1 Tax=Subtercola boreus TaxID=120213 RepID=A0A3E0VID5_9MICO|nr:DUF559 domain-containing protein [Subtercola boreus]RFA09712.1 hypothetical protein B7R54_11200 [Subtercola boreus]TQL53190.1 uncharacterized protein DUF559 [Subtercola boreus]
MPELKPLPAALTGIPFTNRTAHRLGVGAGRLRSADLRAPFHGVHTSAGAGRQPGDEDRLVREAVARCHAFATVLRPGERFSHTTAALLWGAALPRSFTTAPLHVAVPDPARARRARGTVGHTLPPSPMVIRRGLPVTDPTTTWFGAAQLLSLDELVALGDHLIHRPVHPVRGDRRPYVTLAELEAHARSARGPSVNRARVALALMNGRAESRPESLLRLLLHRAGLPKPEVNPELCDSTGRRIGRADLVFREARVIVEYDGQQHRTNDRQYEKDATRLERFHLDDWHVIRVRKEGLFDFPRRTTEHISEILRRRVASAVSRGRAH